VKKFILLKNGYCLPQIWTEDREECVSDRVFNDFGPLLAAAPELLNSLDRILTDVTEGDISRELKVNPESMGCVKQARAAIAKATS